MLHTSKVDTSQKLTFLLDTTEWESWLEAQLQSFGEEEVPYTQYLAKENERTAIA